MKWVEWTFGFGNCKSTERTVGFENMKSVERIANSITPPTHRKYPQARWAGTLSPPPGCSWCGHERPHHWHGPCYSRACARSLEWTHGRVAPVHEHSEAQNFVIAGLTSAGHVLSLCSRVRQWAKPTDGGLKVTRFVDPRFARVPVVRGLSPQKLAFTWGNRALPARMVAPQFCHPRFARG